MGSDSDCGEKAKRTGGPRRAVVVVGVEVRNVTTTGIGDGDAGGHGVGDEDGCF